jgi:hypothetical protein
VQKNHTYKDSGARTRHQTIERYLRLIKNTPNEARRDYLRGLVAEEQQKQKDAKDPKYPY